MEGSDETMAEVVPDVKVADPERAVVDTEIIRKLAAELSECNRSIFVKQFHGY